MHLNIKINGISDNVLVMVLPNTSGDTYYTNTEFTLEWRRIFVLFVKNVPNANNGM